MRNDGLEEDAGHSSMQTTDKYIESELRERRVSLILSAIKH